MDDIIITGKHISLTNRIGIPEEGVDINELYHMDAFPFHLIKDVHIYKREKIACPLARGNWMIEFHMIDGSIQGFKLPLEMEESAVMTYCKPFFDILNEVHKSLN